MKPHSHQTRLQTSLAASSTARSLSPRRAAAPKPQSSRKTSKQNSHDGTNKPKPNDEIKKVPLELEALENSLMQSLSKIIKEKDLEIEKVNNGNEELARGLEEVRTKLKLVEKEKEEAKKLVKAIDPLEKALATAEQKIKSLEFENSDITGQYRTLREGELKLREEQRELKAANLKLKDQMKEVNKNEEKSFRE